MLLAAGLSGCDLTTDPFQIQLQFFDDYSATADGCEVTFQAVALGNGHAEWDQFTHRVGDQVIATYNAEEFWGTTRIEAGEEQTSITLDQPEVDGEYLVQMDFRTGRTPRSLLFSTDCPPEQDDA